MSTSGSYSFSVSAAAIIRQALLNIHALDPVDPPRAEDLSDCMIVLNMLCKQWMGKTDFAPGLKVWTRQRGHLFLSGSTGKLIIGPSAVGWTLDYARSTAKIAAASGAGAVTLASTAGVATGYHIGVILDSGDLFWTTASGVAGLVVSLSDTLPSAASAGNYVFSYQTAAQNPLQIETAVLRDDDNSDTPLRVMTVQSYDYLPNKADPTNEGDPSAIYVERRLGESFVYLDVGAAQDVSKHIVLTFLEPVQDFTSVADEPYYPQEWYLALCWGLSEQIAPMYRASWTQKQEQLKNSALAIAREGDPEKSELFFQPGADD